MNNDQEINRTRWQHMEEIYHTALTLVAPERQAFIAQSCAGDSTLQEEVVSLLAADDGLADFLREPVVDLGLAVLAGDEGLEGTQIRPQPAQSASGDLTGKKIADRYEIVERLGSGGFGDVYKAVDPKLLSRLIVIKVLKHDVLGADTVRRDWLVIKFQQEIEALAKIHDPGVVGIFDADTLPDGRPYIVMEFVEGTDLRHFIEQGRQAHPMMQGLKFDDMAEIVRQVGRTLTAAHNTGIFHRDLKPENIMLHRNPSGDLQVKVIDFGIAKIKNSLVASSAATEFFIAGTWHYMSPEQLQGKKVSAACDIYALGVIAYEMIASRYPFAARDRSQLIEMQAAGVKVKPCDLIPDLPIAAQEAILKALSYDPAARYQRARDFGDELARALTRGGESFDIQRRPVFPSASLPHLGRHWVLTILAALLAGLIIFAVWRADRRDVPHPLQPETAATPNVGPERTLTYWFMVQGKNDKEPLASIGDDEFHAGSRFQLSFQTGQPGALYVFSEGNNDEGATEWNMMFPTNKNNSGDPRLLAHSDAPFMTDGYSLSGPRSKVTIWLIWARERDQVLDEIVGEALSHTGGVISEPEKLRAFIKKHQTPRPEVALDRELFRITLKGRNDFLVDERELNYQP